MARPKGAENKDKPYRDALRRAIARAVDSPKSLDRIADIHLAQAAAGEMSAIKELADRLDGKPVQGIEHSGDTQTYIVRMPSVISSLPDWDKHAQATLEQDTAH